MASKYYQGRFIPRNPKKYKGDPTKIFYRSSWECKLMSRFDTDENFISWSSEEIMIPYVSPVDNKNHRYYPDFLCIIRTTTGQIKTLMVEVKPYKQTQQPKIPKRKSARYLTEVATYLINQAKWTNAEIYCKSLGYEFKIITEKDLFKMPDKPSSNK